MRNSRPLLPLLLMVGAMSVVMLFVTLSVFLIVEKRVASAAPNDRTSSIGGMEYQAMSGRPIHPTNPVDRKIIAGLPADARRLRHGEMLFGAFIAFTNSTRHNLRSADRIELRHESGLDRPLPLPASNPYAYTPRVVRPRVRIPGAGSPAAVNLAAGGRLLLFRVPAREYSNGGTFELVIHDPSHPARTVTIVV
jgi:hypothetical protein